MIRFLTAGESHGKGLTAIVEGFPSNLPINAEFIDRQLKRRQQGYGRGGRMKIESDKVEVLSGIRYGKTLGSPISLFIENKDWGNWTDVMETEKSRKKSEKISIPRPGHADLVGVSKYNFEDIRNSIERSSARETAARVAAGSIARRLLEEFDILIVSWVESIGNIFPKENIIDRILENKISSHAQFNSLGDKADRSQVRVLNKEHEDKIIRKIKSAKKKGDTLGGTFFTAAVGAPAGLGSYAHYDTKISADIARAIMSINAVKSVEIGAGIDAAKKYGSNMHDEIIFKNNRLMRKTNFAGGIEGGVTTGMPVIVRGAMKPIATLMSPIGTIDLKTFKKIEARRERSDFVAVPACAVIAESMLAWVIADHFIRKFGGDSIEETRDNFNTFNRKLLSRIKRNMK